MPSVVARSACAQLTTHIEFELSGPELRQFARELDEYARAHPNVTEFHLQIQRRGVAPPAGGTAPIAQGDQVTVTLHQFR